MKLIPESDNLKDYLIEDRDVDFSHLVIREKVNELLEGSENETLLVKKVFEFVRDQIFHSWDIQSTRITRRASLCRQLWSIFHRGKQHQ